MTPHELQSATGCTSHHADLYAQPITDAMAKWGIGSLKRKAAFLAQIAHESEGFSYAVEGWGPTEAQSRYEGRADLGNTRPGDGYLYRGRGFIQITGRFNYRQCGDALGIDLIDTPALLKEPKHAADSAGWYWSSRGCNELADHDHFEAITIKINGGLNGHTDRIARHKRALAALIMAENAKPLPVVVPLPEPAPSETQPAAPIIEAGRDADPEEVLETIAERQTMSDKISDVGRIVGGVASIANPFVGAAITALSGLIPEIAKLFPGGSEVAQRNVKLASAVIETVTAAVGAQNAQEAVQRIQADPEAAGMAQAAVKSAWFDLQEAGGGGIEGARKFAEENPGMNGVLKVVTMCALGFLAFANIAVFGGLLAAVIVGAEVTRDLMPLATVVLQADIGAAISAISFWLGSSFGSQKKTDIYANGNGNR